MEEDEKNPLAKVEALAKKQPWYVWAGVAIGALLVGYTVLKARATAASSSTAAGSTTAGTQASSLNGYDVSGLAGIPYAQEPGQLNNYPDPGISGTTPPATTTPPAPTTRSAVTRLKGTGNPGWDSSQNGLPWTDTTGKPLPHIPWGALITLNSPIANGSNQYSISYNGQQGLIHTNDVQPFANQGSGGDFQTEVNNHRVTMDRRAGWHGLETGSEL